MADELSHLDEAGAARMVDVSGKSVTKRTAIAEGRIFMARAALMALCDTQGPKGDAMATARIAGIMAAKRTSDLIPLCHPLALDSVTVNFDVETVAIRVVTEVALTDKTGVEMEALTAASVALLTLYDMGKAVDKAMRIEGVRLLSKSGGKSGDWEAQD